MTAGIFSRHGVWTGTCRPPTKRNEKGFFENIDIKNVIIEMQGAIVHAGVLAKEVDGFRSRVIEARDGDGYESGQWLWKGSALYWPAWFEFNPKYVVCRRDREATFQSCRTARKVFGDKLSDRELRRNIDFHHEQLDYLVSHGAYEVDTAAVASGDFVTIKRAIEGCGIEFNESVSREFVEPDLWHHG